MNFKFSFVFFIFFVFLPLFFTSTTFAATGSKNTEQQKFHFDCRGLANSADAQQRKQIKKCIERDNQTVYLNRQYLEKFSKLTQFWSPKQKEIAKKQTFMKLNKNFNDCLKSSAKNNDHHKNQQNLVSVVQVCKCWQNAYSKHIQFMQQDFSK